MRKGINRKVFFLQKGVQIDMRFRVILISTILTTK